MEAKGHSRPRTAGLLAAPHSVSPSQNPMVGRKLRSRATALLTRGANRGGPDDPSKSHLVTSPCARRLRRWLPWGRLQSGWDTELRSSIKCRAIRTLAAAWGRRALSHGTEAAEEGRTSRGPRAGEAGAAPPWWPGGHVGRRPPCARVSKAPRAIHQVSPGKRLRPHVQPEAPVDEKPLKGRAERLRSRPPCGARARCALADPAPAPPPPPGWRWRVARRAVVSARCGPALQRPWGRGEKVAGRQRRRAGGCGRAGRHAGRRGRCDSSCGAGGASFAESAGPVRGPVRPFRAPPPSHPYIAFWGG